MGVTLEFLDNSHEKENPIIIIGKEVVLKFIPEKCIIYHKQSLQEFVNKKDLCIGDLLSATKELIKKSKDTEKKLEEHIKFQEKVYRYQGIKTAEEIKAIDSSNLKILGSTKAALGSLSAEIKKIDRTFEPILTENFLWFFCKDCISYICGQNDILPFKCPVCGGSLLPQTVTYLDRGVSDYLNGKWFEDYVANLLRKVNWETWCHGSILGASGSQHPLDILAINRSSSKIIVIECKTSEKSFDDKDILSFITRCEDIRCYKGLFLVLEECRKDFQDKKMLEKISGLAFVDGLMGLSDQKIINKLESALI